jgi:broad specificity phosphatase PhoE
MELVCVRHGRTCWNAERRFQGQTDIPLDAAGRAQAQALGAHLRDEPFGAAFASDLGRARETAGAILAGRDLTPTFDADLREMHFGVWEGMTWPEITTRWPELASEYEASPRDYTPEGGEPWDAVCVRVERALRRIEDAVDETARVLVVSHAGVMHAILHIVRPLASDDMALRIKLVPAGIVRIHGSFADGFAVDAINETAAPLSAPA